MPVGNIEYVIFSNFHIENLRENNDYTDLRANAWHNNNKNATNRCRIARGFFWMFFHHTIWLQSKLITKKLQILFFNQARRGRRSLEEIRRNHDFPILNAYIDHHQILAGTITCRIVRQIVWWHFRHKWRPQTKVIPEKLIFPHI